MNPTHEEAIAKANVAAERMKTDEPIEAIVKDICTYLPEFDGETCLVWIKQLVAGEPSEPREPAEQEQTSGLVWKELPVAGQPAALPPPPKPVSFKKRMQALNVELNMTQAYKDAVTRLHAWKETQKKPGEG